MKIIYKFGVVLSGRGVVLLAASFFSQAIAMELVDYAQTEQMSFMDLLREYDFEKAKKLIVSGKVSPNEMNNALFFAVEVNQVDLACLLISKGADVNAVIRYGRTPLHVAATRKDKEMTELLIAYEANVNAVDDTGWPPLYFAVICNNGAVVESLINGGANRNAVNSEGWTVLHFAACYLGNANIVKYLLFEGVNYKKKDQHQLTAYDVTKNNSIKEILKDEKSVKKAIQSVREKVKREICVTKCNRTNLFTSVMNQQITGSFKSRHTLMSGNK